MSNMLKLGSTSFSSKPEENPAAQQPAVGVPTCRQGWLQSHLTCSAYWGREQDRQRQGRAGAGVAGVTELVPMAPTAGVCSPGWSPITRLLVEGYLATFHSAGLSG